MSNVSCARVLVPIIIGIGGTFFILYLMFESLGIGEYVWPIMFPILGGTFGIIVLIMVIVVVACQSSQRIPTDTEMVQRTYLQPTYRTGDYSDGAVYTVPVYCPHCRYNIELNQVEWVGSSELTCPNCFRIIQVGIREHL